MWNNFNELSEKKIYQADIVKTELVNDYIINLNNIEDISKIIIGNFQQWNIKRNSIF